jgi:hypothetical protein
MWLLRLGLQRWWSTSGRYVAAFDFLISCNVHTSLENLFCLTEVMRE